MRGLVTGAGGLIGGRLAYLLTFRGFSVVAGRHNEPPPAEIPTISVDVTSAASREAALTAVSPDAVLHAAAFAGAADCERRPEEAFALNARAAGDLAALCRSRGIRFVAVSTDLVLAGDRPFADESEPARPLMVYGRTKLQGEEAVRAAFPEAAVVRLPLMVGRGHGPRATGSEAIAWALRRGRPMPLFTDEYRTPVDPESVVPALAALLEGRGRGLFHLGGPERVSRYELGQRTARVFGLPESLLAPVSAETHLGPPRPRDTSLDSARARHELGYAPRPLDEALQEGRLRAG
jgi:dTDP-4-dehydrorhamnose reductase